VAEFHAKRANVAQRTQKKFSRGGRGGSFTQSPPMLRKGHRRNFHAEGVAEFHAKRANVAQRTQMKFSRAGRGGVLRKARQCCAKDTEEIFTRRAWRNIDKKYVEVW
jgi:hypothetical protein